MLHNWNAKYSHTYSSYLYTDSLYTYNNHCNDDKTFYNDK